MSNGCVSLNAVNKIINEMSALNLKQGVQNQQILFFENGDMFSMINMV